MKIKNLKPLNDGMKKESAEQLWADIEKYSSYSFCAAHAVSYSVISFYCMWVKTHYPLEFYAAALSVEEDETALRNLIKDAEAQGIAILPPDINRSSTVFEVGSDGKSLVTPFKRVKGLSESTAREIVNARDKVGGAFSSFTEFYKTIPKSKVNKRHQETLDKVGAFASLPFTATCLARGPIDYPYISLDQRPVLDPDRLRDQTMLLPGIMTRGVSADRKMHSGKETDDQLLLLAAHIEHCQKCSLNQQPRAYGRLGRSAKVMIVVDVPSFNRDDEHIPISPSIAAAMKVADISPKDVYVTSMVKCKRDGKAFTNDQINSCLPYFEQELEILHPPVILALGSQAIRHFIKDVKSGYKDLIGQIHYLPDRKATLVCGFNPGMIFHKPDHQEYLNDVMKIVRGLI